jgi:hypothetical protein
MNNRHYGPHLGAVAIVFTALFMVSLVITGAMTQGAAYPKPSWPDDLVRDYFIRFARMVRITSFLQFSAAIPLGVFTATLTSKLRFFGATAAGVNIALFGGIAAAVFLALSGLTGWVISQPTMAAAGSPLHAFQLFAFATGGVGHIAGLGLLLAGAAIPAGMMRLIPRWLMWLGLVTAAFAELSVWSLVFPALYFLIPLGRFPAFIWMICAGWSLQRNPSRHSE